MTWINLIANSPIHYAAYFGDLTELERLVFKGTDINIRADLSSTHGSFFRQLTPLMIAAGSNNGATVKTLKWLIEHDANIYARSLAGVTAAWYAAGNIELLQPHEPKFNNENVLKLEYLLDLGLDPNESSSNGRSLLTEACRVGDPSRVQLLLERGAKSKFVEKVNPYIIPIFRAAQSGSVECVRLILEQGTSPNTRDDTNRTALAYAGNAGVAEILINAGADINTIDSYGKDAFQVILEDRLRGSERFEIEKVLLNAGVNIDYVDKSGDSRLYYAAFSSSVDAVEFLLKYGATPHAQLAQNKSPLHAVCWDANYKETNYEPTVQIINLLLNAGIDVNIKDSMGDTPLHEAVFGDGANITAVKTLIKRGAKVDSVSNDGMTPLMLAASRAEAECVYILLEAGADKTRTDNNAKTAVHHIQNYYETLEREKNKLSNSDSEDLESLEKNLQRARKCLTIL